MDKTEKAITFDNLYDLLLVVLAFAYVQGQKDCSNYRNNRNYHNLLNFKI